MGIKLRLIPLSVVATVLIAACATTHSVAFDPQTGIPASSTTRPAGWSPPSNLNSNLPAPVSQMSGNQLRDFVNGLGKGGVTPPVQIPCVTPVACPGGTTPVSILATDEDYYLTSKNEGPNGNVVAVVSGVQFPTKGYHFTPNSIFVFVVYKGGDSTSTWQLYQIPNGSNSHAMVDHGVFRECTPGQTVYWAESAATFAECGRVHHANASAMSPIPVAGLGTIDVSILHDGFSRMLASYNSETSGWLTCESGCCTMDQA